MKDSAGKVVIGTFRVVTNGSEVSYNDMSVETDATGISFAAVVSGGNINVTYDSGATTAVARMDVKLIKA
jgi:hypothetical protein